MNGPDKALILSLLFDGEPSFIALHRQLVDARLQFRVGSHAHDFPSDARSKTAAQAVEEAVEHFVVGRGSETGLGSHNISLPAARGRYNAMKGGKHQRDEFVSESDRWMETASSACRLGRRWARLPWAAFRKNGLLQAEIACQSENLRFSIPRVRTKLRFGI